MNLKSFFTRKKLDEYLVPFVFIIYLFAGLAVYDDYGVSTDENTERVTATYALLYSVNEIAELFHADSISQRIKKDVNPKLYADYKYNIYGNNFQIPVLLIEAAVFGVKKSPNEGIYNLRHLVTFLFFYVSVIFFYFLIRNISGKRSVALLTTLMLIFTPRFFAESFYNPKDLVFFSACIIGMFFYVRFLKEKSLKNGILLGVFTAYASGFRILGVQFIMMAVFFLCCDFILKRKINKNEIRSILAAIACFIALIIFFYPASWHSPLSFFTMLFSKVAMYPHHSVTLFMGDWIYSDNAPWYYLPFWMLITIPVLYIVLFLHGVYGAARELVSINRLKEFTSEYQVLLSAVVMFFVPLLGVIIKKSSVFNAWRHMSFLYLSFLVIAAFSIKLILDFMESRGKAKVVYAVFGVYFLSLGIWMIINHPYQYAFFNAVPQKIESDFQKDYWAVSMVDGMKHILNVDNSEKVVVKRSNGTAKHSRYKLPKELKNRIEVMPDDSSTPDEFNYFFYNGDDFDLKDYAKEKNLTEVHSIQVYNSIYTQKYKIMSIYKK